MSVKVHTRRLDQQHLIITQLDLQSLITVARQVAPVEVEELQDDLPTEGLMRLAESSVAFDFLLDEREDIYSPQLQAKLDAKLKLALELT